MKVDYIEYTSLLTIGKIATYSAGGSGFIH
jgi:hypothetical protein